MFCSRWALPFDSSPCTMHRSYSTVLRFPQDLVKKKGAVIFIYPRAATSGCTNQVSFCPGWD